MPSGYHLTVADIVILLLSFAVVLLISLRCAKNAVTVDGYFLADRSARGWVVGVSFIGTSISALTFLAFPAASYGGNWAGLVPFLVTPLIAVIADRVWLPIYRHAGITSCYEYLERRFGTFARAYGSVMFLLLQIGRLALILVLLSLPLELLTSLRQTHAIVLCGLFTTFYVLVGGLTAVLWTDLIQTILLAFGGLFCVGLICWELPGGLATIIEVGWQANKFDVPPLHLAGQPLGTDFMQLTLGVLIAYGVFNQLLYFSADQNVIQRYLATSTDREARKALWIGSLGMVLMIAFFTFLGTCLYAYYAKMPDAAVSLLSPDEVFPHFILTCLPRGIVGCIVAGLVAAAMSSIDSNLNAISMVFQTDVYRRHLVKHRSDGHYLRVGKLTTLAAGAIMTFGALGLTMVSAETVLDLMFLVYAVFAGGVASLFLLGMFARRATAAGVTVGILVSLAVSIYLTCSHFGWILPDALRSPTHPYLIGAISNVSLLVAGYGASLVCRRKHGELAPRGLTVWTSEFD